MEGTKILPNPLHRAVEPPKYLFMAVIDAPLAACVAVLIPFPLTTAQLLP
ncbi:MAG: hypothetical protein HWN65_15365 [Candidatus Helarchaeota archaeon]|nr:hypothetical protein [Candidatus Helarchaeota archaeon]